MRRLWFSVLALSVCSMVAEAQNACESPPAGDAAMQFGRTHQVPHVAEGTRTIRSKDGTTLEVPALVDITDNLIVWRETSTDLCFSLTTYARNGHECGIQGLAIRQSPRKYLFTDKSCSIRIVRLFTGRMRIEPLGPDCKTPYCGMFGVIERATYVLRSTDG